jgi:hypothetical protein
VCVRERLSLIFTGIALGNKGQASGLLRRYSLQNMIQSNAVLSKITYNFRLSIANSQISVSFYSTYARGFQEKKRSKATWSIK